MLNATKVSFSFENVIRKYVDIGALAKILTIRKVDLNSLIVKDFIIENSKCVIVDSTITSNNFSIKVEETTNTSFSFNLPEIQNILKSQNNEIGVYVSGTTEISFRGEEQLAFAFTGFILNIEEDGSLYFEGEPDRMFLTKSPSVTIDTDSIPPSFIIEDEFGLSEIEFD